MSASENYGQRRARKDEQEHTLKSDHGSTEAIESHDSFVVCRPETGEKLCRNGEKGNVLDIRIVFGMIRYKMMNVVIVLPPAQAEAADPVCDKGAQNTIRDVVARNSGVTGVMRND